MQIVEPDSTLPALTAKNQHHQRLSRPCAAALAHENFRAKKRQQARHLKTTLVQQNARLRHPCRVLQQRVE